MSAQDARRPRHWTRQDQTVHCAAGERALHVGPVDGLARQVADRIPQDLQLQVQGRPCNRNVLGVAENTCATL